MMTENLALWKSVEKTDPGHVKAITGKSYSGTSPKPHYLVMRATETFGPCGIGWGFSVDERIEDGAMIEPGFFEKIHVAKVKVWFKWNGERGEVEHIGGTVFSGRRKSGAGFSDEDAPKKSVTDALVKALSMIGFAGDIFMGRYDDSKYVSEIGREFKDAKEADDHPSHKAYAAKFTERLSAINDLTEIRGLWKAEQEIRLALGLNGTAIEKDLRAKWQERGIELAKMTEKAA